MHSSDCYSGITSICSILNRATVKSRLNTAPSYRAILARVCVAERVQIWCRPRETSGSCCLLASWFGSSFLGSLSFFSQVFYAVMEQHTHSCENVLGLWAVQKPLTLIYGDQINLIYFTTTTTRTSSTSNTQYFLTLFRALVWLMPLPLFSF